jgi:hypothetical protein
VDLLVIANSALVPCTGIGASLGTVLAGYVSDKFGSSVAFTFGSSVAFTGLAGVAAAGLGMIWLAMPETRRSALISAGIVESRPIGRETHLPTGPALKEDYIGTRSLTAVLTRPCCAGAGDCAARSGERRKIRELLARGAAKAPLRPFPA